MENLQSRSCIFIFLFLFIFIVFFGQKGFCYLERNGGGLSSDSKENLPDKNKKTYEQLFLESLLYFPKDAPPIIVEYLKNPNNPELIKYVDMYIKYRLNNAAVASENLQKLNSSNIEHKNSVETEKQHKDEKQPDVLTSKINTQEVSFLDGLLKKLSQNNFKAMYFFSPECPYCMKSKPYVQKIATYMPLNSYSFNAENKVIFERWKVSNLPTLFFIRGKNAYKFEGLLTETSLVNFIKGIIKDQGI